MASPWETGRVTCEGRIVMRADGIDFSKTYAFERGDAETGRRWIWTGISPIRDDDGNALFILPPVLPVVD